jgi:hypothetical protein
MTFRGILSSSALIVSAGALFLLEGVVTMILGAMFAWSRTTILTTLVVLAVVTLIAVIRLKRKYTVEVPRASRNQVNLDIRSLGFPQWTGLAIAFIGGLLWFENQTGTFTTFPFFGSGLIAVGVTIFTLARPKAGKLASAETGNHEAASQQLGSAGGSSNVRQQQKMSLELPRALCEKASSFPERSNGATYVTLVLKNGSHIPGVVLAWHTKIAWVGGRMVSSEDELGFEISEIADVVLPNTSSEA